MPRTLSSSVNKATLTLACDISEAPPPAPPPTKPKSFGFGEGACTCARCMRKAGPIREDVEERLIQIAYVLANVYSDTPNPDDLVTDEHRQKAQAFMTAVEEGNATRLCQMFGELDPADGMAEEVASELIISSAQLGHVDVTQRLLDYGANIEEKDLRRGGRPLMHAANNGHLPAVKVLLDNHADVEARDDNGYTALMVAIFSDRSSVAEALLAAGAQVDAVDDKGRSALSYAAMYGSTDCVYILSSAGAHMFLTDRDGAMPLDLAEESGRSAAVEALKKLQQKVKMQERRKNKQKAQGCSSSVSDFELAKREAEAAARAQQLLLEIEAENARKVAKAMKKTKKKGKGQASDCATGDTGSGEIPDGGAHGAQQADRPNGGPEASAGGTQEQASRSGSTSADDQDTRSTPDSYHTHRESPASAPAAPPSSKADAHEALRQEWEAVLEEAAKCVDEATQPRLLAYVSELLPRCAAAGISVKYGRKVLQRLELVGPARVQLKAAVAAPMPTWAEVDAALKSCRSARCLLDNTLVGEAEALLERLKIQEEQARWDSLAMALSWDHGKGAVGAGDNSRPSVIASHPAYASSHDDDYIDEEQECVVCLSAVKSSCCIPCGHVCMCQECAQEVHASRGLCPVCRTSIECVIQILN